MVRKMLVNKLLVGGRHNNIRKTAERYFPEQEEC